MIRSAVVVLVVVFVGYAIYTNPAVSADFVHAVWQVIVNALGALFAFFGDLINGGKKA